MGTHGFIIFFRSPPLAPSPSTLTHSSNRFRSVLAAPMVYVAKFPPLYSPVLKVTLGATNSESHKLWVPWIRGNPTKLTNDLTFEHPLDFKYVRRGWIAVSSEPKTGSDISAERKKARFQGILRTHCCHWLLPAAYFHNRFHVTQCISTCRVDTRELEKRFLLNN